MELLNVGCGRKVFNYATNIDIKADTDLNIIEGNAYKLDTLYEPDSIDMIYMLCPYDYYPLQSKALKILKTHGLLVVTGNYSNTYFRELWMISETLLESLGYETVSKKRFVHPEFSTSYTSDGDPIEPNTLKQIRLRKR